MDPEPGRTTVAGPFDSFLYQSDAADEGDFLTSRIFDVGGDVAPFLKRPGTLPYTDHASRERWIETQLKPILTQLANDERRCLYCNSFYKNIENIGSWKCSWHPQGADYDGFFLCCNRAAPTNGCQPCDHNSTAPVNAARWNLDNYLIDVPTAVVDRLQVQSKSYVYLAINQTNTARSLYRIRRAKMS
jgi:hypothetical protein